MSAVMTVARGIVRRGRWSTVVLILLIAVAGGAVMAAAAGARRTHTVYPRLNEATGSGDVQISPVTGDVDLDAVAALPEVERSGRLFAFSVYPDEDGLSAEQTPQAFASADGRLYYELDQPFVVEGRMPDPTVVEEAVVNETLAARRGIGIGDRFPVTLVDFAALFEYATRGDVPSAEEFVALQTPIDLEIVGISRSQSEILLYEDDLSREAILLGPAFAERFAGQQVTEAMVVSLRHGADDAAAFKADVRALFPDAQIEMPTLTGKLETVSRSLRPYEDSLRLFAIVAAVTAFLVLGQALARQVALDAADAPTLRALGLSQYRRSLAITVRGALIGLVGAALAVVVAAAASGLFPIGQARQFDIDPGIRLEVPVLVTGFFVILVLVVLRTAVAAWWAVRPHRERRRTGPDVRIVGRLARAGFSPQATTGVEFALHRPPGTVGWFLTPFVGLVAATAAVATVLVFGASLDHVSSTPRLYGWNWDVLIEGYDGTVDAVADEVYADDDLASVTSGVRTTVDVDGDSLLVFAFETGPELLQPTITEGRLPEESDEIALGADSLRDLDRSIGDTVTAVALDGSERDYTITGRAVVPVLSLGETVGLADGAVATLDGLQALDPSIEPSFLAADVRGSLADVQERYDTEAAVNGPQRPSEILSYDRIRRAPLVLALVLAALAAGVVAHAVLSGVRRQRRDLAVLKTIGCVPRQLRAVVGWQATTLVTVALCVGIPLGVVVGRFGYRFFAEDLGVVPAAVVPVFAVLVIVPVALLIANLVAIVPAWRAARSATADALRPE